jgi:hypothetical protein
MIFSHHKTLCTKNNLSTGIGHLAKKASALPGSQIVTGVKDEDQNKLFRWQE